LLNRQLSWLCAFQNFVDISSPSIPVSEATLYNWKAKYGGLEVSEAKRLRAIEDENRKLKKLLAESMLDNAALKDLLSKKW
jgi:putative transposase